jgi:hypothetical protein
MQDLNSIFHQVFQLTVIPYTALTVQIPHLTIGSYTYKLTMVESDEIS